MRRLLVPLALSLVLVLLCLASSPIRAAGQAATERPAAATQPATAQAEAGSALLSCAHQISLPVTAGPLHRMLEGFHAYQHRLQADPKLFRAITRDQHPDAMILSCCDSRVDPALIFGAKPGEIFVHRILGAFVPPFESPQGSDLKAAIYYALEHLGISDIVILGHTACGAIAPLVKGYEATAMEEWLHVMRPVLDTVRRRLPIGTLPQIMGECERLTPLYSLANLAEYPWVKARLAEQSLTILVWLYDTATARLFTYDFVTGQYRPVTQ